MNILKDLLTKYRNEVMEVCLFECNVERAQQFIIEDLREELRVAIRDELKEEIRGKLKEEVRSEMKKDLRGEVEKEVRGEMKQEVKDEVKQEVRNEVEKEVRDKVKKEIRDDLKRKASEKAQKKMIATVCKMIQRGDCTAEIAEILSEDLAEIEFIYNVVSEYPEYGINDIFIKMQNE